MSPFFFIYKKSHRVNKYLIIYLCIIASSALSYFHIRSNPYEDIENTNVFTDALLVFLIMSLSFVRFRILIAASHSPWSIIKDPK